MERLEANWGPPKDRTAGQMVVMTREWFSQLERFGCKTVTDAFTHVIGNHEFQWAGVFPKILGFCTRDDREWRDVVAAKVLALPAPAREPEKFERDGRTREEEIEFRAQEIAEMKRRAGFGKHVEEIPGTPKKSEPKQASLDMTVSAHVLNSCAARRARKLPTCHENCIRKSCELRERETMQ